VVGLLECGEKEAAMKKMCRWGIGLFILLILCFWWCWPDEKLRLIVCDVGQGDAILLAHRFTQVLIDGGPNNGRVLSCLGRYVPFWDRTIELVVMTHEDHDHAGGLGDVLNRFEIGSLLVPIDKTEVVTVAHSHQIPVILAPAVESFQVGLMRFTVLWPREVLSTNNLNDSSIVLDFSYGQRTAIFMADVPVEVELKLLHNGRINSRELIKIGHHGSKTSTSKELLSKVMASIAVISAGKTNRFGHPHKEVIDRLNENNVRILRSDMSGNIVLVSDKKGWLEEQ
jgi:competence protein ComEC